MGKNKSVLLSLLAVFFVGQALMMNGVLWPRWKKVYCPPQIGDANGLDPGQFLVALAGFREMIAGILWVRADSFFESGNYDAILPIIRLVTILDPHQIDVYATGMWHIGYNFTDEEQRSDRRYLPTAIALGEEGSRQNPQTYEMYFETGWMWFQKVDDIYPKAVHWMELAGAHDDIPPARRNMLAKAYERNGQIDKMVEYDFGLLDKAKELLKKDDENAFQNRQGVDVIENNLDNLLVRMVQRGYRAQELGIYSQGDYDTKPPFDIGFSAKVSVTDAMVLKIEGTYNVLPLGSRIRVVLRDASFPYTVPGGVIWDKWQEVKLDPDKTLTYMQDQLFVRNQRFSKKIDMSKDPTMYPFVGKDYIVEFYYSPRSAPPHIQDKFGWNGEGMTDKFFVSNKLSGQQGVPDGRDGVNCLYTTLPLSRDQIRRKGDYADKVPVVKTKNYKEAASVNIDEDVIVVPSMRGK